jgi:hypothetical protein
MVCSALIAPATAMAGGLCSRPQTWARNFPANFWLIVMSWCVVLSNCGCFSWLRSEQCFLSPVGLGGNWYILLQPRKKILIQTMVQRSKMPSSTTLPAPLTLLPYSSYVDLLYPPPTQTAQASAHASSSLVSRQWKLTTMQQ